MGKKLTNKEFIEKAKEIHGDKYDYSLTEYIGATNKVKIICKEHGVFEQIPRSHFIYEGCPKCKNEKYSFVKLKSKENYFKEIKKIHNDDYTYLSDYKNIKTKLKIKCNKCNNIFFQNPSKHLNGQGCPICGELKRIKSRSSTIEKFIEKAKKIHGDKYDYSLVKYLNAKTKVKIICSKHGVFEQIPDNHLANKGCPKCRTSKGEINIQKILNDNNISYDYLIFIYLNIIFV